MKVVCLAGGVGGARLADGFCGLEGGELTVVVNTGDDFEHLGLYICPDLDTVLYNLAELADPVRGWGVSGDSSRALQMIKRLGGPDWFFLGDADLGVHVWRTEQLRSGRSLTEVTQAMVEGLGLNCQVLPMTDDRFRTQVRVADTWLDFQDYFVKRQHRDEVSEIRFEGADSASSTQATNLAIEQADLLVVCPSNPFLSIDPILEIHRQAIVRCKALKVAVSPILGGQAVKGPAAALLASLGHPVSALGVAQLYKDWVDIFVLDDCDKPLLDELESLGVKGLALPTWMHDRGDRIELARKIFEHAVSVL